MKRFFNIQMLIIFFTQTLCVNALAWFEPGIQISSGFNSIATTLSTGRKNKISSQLLLDLAPDLTWVVNERQSRFRIQPHLCMIDFSRPDTITTIANNPSILYGMKTEWIHPIQKFSLSFGLSGDQVLVFDSTSNTALVLKKGLLFSFPVDLIYKLVSLEGEVIKIGAGGSIALPNQTGEAKTDLSSNFHVNYEHRGETTFAMELGIRNHELTTRYGSQLDTTIHLSARLSFPGRKGVGPTPDERE